MKKVLYFCAIALIAVSCKSKQAAGTIASTKHDVEVEVPCTGSKYYSDSKTFRATGEGYSNSMTTAKDKALQVARQRMAASIEATMKSVVDNYASSYESGLSEESKSKYESLSRTVINRKLQGVIVICDKLMQTQEGQFRAYVCVELSGNELLQEINNEVSTDDKLRIDYEYEKFKQTYEEEMKKLEEENK